ncbi:MAG: prolipoprotein diacylglyceryl transferase [Gemmatimonadaceae bacterium]
MSDSKGFEPARSAHPLPFVGVLDGNANRGIDATVLRRAAESATLSRSLWQVLALVESRYVAVSRLTAVRQAPGVRWHPYPTMLLIGMSVGVALGTLFASRRGLPADRAFIGYTVLLVPALLGARVLHVIRKWPHYRANPRLILSRNDGGLALYGGLILTLIVSWPLLAALALPAARFWDGAAVVILVGMAFTKLGCHLNGCCAGRRTTGRWSVQLRRDPLGVRRTPAQLLEGALALLLLTVLVPASTAYGAAGSLFWSASLGYAAGRFVLEGMRDTFDARRRLNSNRWISLALGGAALVALFIRR